MGRDQKTIDLVRKLLKEGKTYKEIAQITGKSVNAITLIKSHYLNNADRKNMTVSQVARVLGISKREVREAERTGLRKLSFRARDLKIHLESDHRQFITMPAVPDRGIPWRTIPT